MKRLRGACRGCKCASCIERGVYCESKNKIIKAPPKECSKRIDAARYLEDDE